MLDGRLLQVKTMEELLVGWPKGSRLMIMRGLTSIVIFRLSFQPLNRGWPRVINRWPLNGISTVLI